METLPVFPLPLDSYPHWGSPPRRLRDKTGHEKRRDSSWRGWSFTAGCRDGGSRRSWPAWGKKRTLVPNLGDGFKAAVAEGAVTGGGLAVIANAPNPAGQAILGRFFDDAVSPVWLFVGALVPTLLAAVAFRLL